jgi:hypothetical protein
MRQVAITAVVAAGRLPALYGRSREATLPRAELGREVEARPVRIRDADGRQWKGTALGFGACTTGIGYMIGRQRDGEHVRVRVSG